MRYLFIVVSVLFFSSHAFSEELYGVIEDPLLESQPKFVISLTPPKTGNLPKFITTTAPNTGEYIFNGLAREKYLLEIFHNDELIHREVVRISNRVRKDIILQRDN